jgi:SAM-dependent methyltransferase
VPSFATFVFEQLPPPPLRILEIGCGSGGGLVERLAAAGYDPLGVDPDAPAGDRYLRATFQAASDTVQLARWDAVVAGRVLHHVEPLEESLDLLASLAPLLLVDEFAHNRVGPAAQSWYEGQYRMLLASGVEPKGPPSLDEWRERHPGLHGDDVLLPALRARWDEILFERVPYVYRWLGGPGSEELERGLIAAGAFEAIGYRWAGASTSTTRSSASSR